MLRYTCLALAAALACAQEPTETWSTGINRHDGVLRIWAGAGNAAEVWINCTSTANFGDEVVNNCGCGVHATKVADLTAGGWTTMNNAAYFDPNYAWSGALYTFILGREPLLDQAGNPMETYCSTGNSMSQAGDVLSGYYDPAVYQGVQSNIAISRKDTLALELGDQTMQTVDVVNDMTYMAAINPDVEALFVRGSANEVVLCEADGQGHAIDGHVVSGGIAYHHATTISLHNRVAPHKSKYWGAESNTLWPYTKAEWDLGYNYQAFTGTNMDVAVLPGWYLIHSSAYCQAAMSDEQLQANGCLCGPCDRMCGAEFLGDARAQVGTFSLQTKVGAMSGVALTTASDGSLSTTWNDNYNPTAPDADCGQGWTECGSADVGFWCCGGAASTSGCSAMYGMCTYNDDHVNTVWLMQQFPAAAGGLTAVGIFLCLTMSALGWLAFKQNNENLEIKSELAMLRTAGASVAPGNVELGVAKAPEGLEASGDMA